MKATRLRPLLLALPLGAAALLLAGAGSADLDPSCTQPGEIDDYQLLRRLSFDLRGRPPNMAEYALIEQGQKPLDLARAWTAHFDPDQGAGSEDQEDFRQQVRKYHQQLFWPNISNVRLTNTFAQLRATSYVDGGPPQVYWLTATSRTKWYYTANPDWTDKPDLSMANSVPPCDLSRPQPASGYYADGYHRPRPQTETYPDGGSGQWVGYRDVVPYWNTDGGSIRVCAYDAQETPTAGRYTYRDGGQDDFPGQTPDGGGNNDSCDSQNGQNHTWCGCGPNLKYCFGPNTPAEISADMTEQMMRVIDQATVGGKPYTDVILGRTSYVSGRLSHYKKYLGDMNSTIGTTYTENDPGERVEASFDPDRPGSLPELSYTDRTWKRVTRTSEHAGVLTLPAYLLRFQTNRSRANRFRIDFLCNYFIPPDQLDDSPEHGACNADTADLMRKCNCRLCHATLEPLAAHWGGFSEAGFSVLNADAGFPEYDPRCAKADGGSSKDGRCNRYYVTGYDYDVPDLNADGGPPGPPDGGAYLGHLKTYLYSDLHPMLATNIAGGPQLLRADVVDNPNHDFAHCTVKKLWAHLQRREMRVEGADNDEAPLLERLSQDFIDSDYDFANLVNEIVAQPQYRRVR